MIEDLSDVILELASGTYDVFRRTAPMPPYVRGVKQPAIETVFTATMSVQPASGLVVQRLPEGKRNRETITIFSPVELKTADSNVEPDEVRIDGGIFEVESVKRYDLLAGYWECVATRTPGS